MKLIKLRVQTWYIMVLAVLPALLMIAVNPAISAPVNKQQIVIFPFAVSSDVDASKAEYTAIYAEDLFNQVNEGLSGNKNYSVFEYNPRIANIQRAVREQKVILLSNEQRIIFTEEEVNKPIDTSFFGTAKAQKYAEVIGIGCAVTGSIDRYEFKEDIGEAQLTVTLQFIDTASGKVKGAFSATGRAAKNPDKKVQNEINIGIAATQDAANKLLTDIGAAKPGELIVAQTNIEKPKPQPSGHKKKGLLPAMILAGILGFALGGG